MENEADDAYRLIDFGVDAIGLGDFKKWATFQTIRSYSKFMCAGTVMPFVVVGSLIGAPGVPNISSERLDKPALHVPSSPAGFVRLQLNNIVAVTTTTTYTVANQYVNGSDERILSHGILPQTIIAHSIIR
jgi:hypothetical protein